MRRPAALALAAAALLAGCAAFDPHNVIGRQFPDQPGPTTSPVPEPPRTTLGPEGRRAAVDFVWQTVNDRYFDPKLNGVDWRKAREQWEPKALAAIDDNQFWELLDRMAGEMRDAHTRVVSPKRAALAERHEAVGLGFGFQPMEGRLAVTSVRTDADAYWAGVRAGMVLEAVDGEPAPAAYARWLAEARQSSTARARHAAAARRLLGGEPGSKVALAFSREDGSRLEVTLARQAFRSVPRVAHRKLPSGLGYIRLTGWSQPLQGAMIDAIRSLKETPGLVIDLRGNPGGSGLMARNVIEQFFAGRTDLGSVLTRTGKPVTLAFDWIELIKLKQEVTGKDTYRNPVAVLVNADSGSASELFAAQLQSKGRATIVGQTTCGCLLAYLGYVTVPGGGKLAYSEVGFVATDGRRIEGEGVKPDLAVPVSLADLRLDRDRPLEEAQALLLRAKPVARADAR